MSVAQLAGVAAVGIALVWPDAAVGVGHIAHAAAVGIVESTRLVDVAPWLVWRVLRPPPLATVATTVDGCSGSVGRGVRVDAGSRSAS